MSLKELDRDTLVTLYLDKAWATFSDAKLAADNGSWSMAANRLYYSIFHATTALFVHDGIEVGSHRGIKAKFGLNYIVTGKMDAGYSKFLAQMETLRDKADYNIMFVARQKDVIPNIPAAEAFIRDIEAMVKAGSNKEN